MEKEQQQRRVAPSEFSPPPSAEQQGWRIKPLWIAAGTIVALIAGIIFFLATAISLRLELAPSNANVEIQGGLNFKIGDAFLLRPGEYQVAVEAQGYHPLERSLSLSDSLNLSLELSPLPGNLEVVAYPEEINALQVRLADRNQSGANPLLIEEIEPGTYSLEVDAPLYAPENLQVEIPGRDQTTRVEVELEPAWAEVTLASSPTAAEVRSEAGELLGQTPLTVRLEEGQRSLSFSKSGYQDASLPLDVARNQPMSPASVTLLPQESRVSLSSTPSGAAVVIDGEYRGETPMQLDLLPGRDYQLRLFKAGYSAHESRFRLEHGENREISQSLSQVNGQLVINVTPADAEIWVDGELLGRGSRELSLSTVDHRVEVRKSGYQTQTRSVLPLQNQRQVVSFSLLTEDEALWASIPQRYQFGGQEFRLFRDPGTVQLGSSRRESGRRANEVEWTADLQRAFYASTKEVTNAQYRRFKPDHSSGNFARQSLDGENQPVVNISWQNAALYCNWLSEQAGLEPFYQTTEGFVSGVNADATGYRLLTEAEWTWLAKMTSSNLSRVYPWGNEPEPRPVGNFAGSEIADEINFTLEISDGYQVTAPVGSFPPNDKGIYDMGGNVAEYLHDWYSAEAPGDGVLTDPLGPEIGEYHVIRGGSWARGYLPQLRLAYRDYDAVGRNDVGFRIARYAR